MDKNSASGGNGAAASAQHPQPMLKKAAAAEAQVTVPEVVNIPLPKEPAEQIAVPASINGRDLTQGEP